MQPQHPGPMPLCVPAMQKLYESEGLFVGRSMSSMVQLLGSIKALLNKGYTDDGHDGVDSDQDGAAQERAQEEEEGADVAEEEAARAARKRARDAMEGPDIKGSLLARV